KDLLLGLPGTKVTLILQREGRPVSLAVTLTRERLRHYETVFGVTRKADASFNHWIDRDRRIAYLRISRLARDTSRDLQALLRKLKTEKMKGLVLDLRFCPGG